MDVFTSRTPDSYTRACLNLCAIGLQNVAIIIITFEMQFCHSLRDPLAVKMGCVPSTCKTMQCRESGSDFLTALTAFVNLVLAGHCPDDIAHTFFGGRLIALNKKSGGSALLL